MITKYRVLRQASEVDVKYTPQEEVVRDTIFSLANVGEAVDREAVIQKIEAEGKLSDSKQLIARVVSTYQRSLILRGLIELEKEKSPRGIKSGRCPHCQEVVYIFKGKLLAQMPELEQVVEEVAEEVIDEVA